MGSRKYVIDGAEVKCTLGTVNGKIKVMSQQKLFIGGKLQATDADKLLQPVCGACKRSNPNPPCTPQLSKWQTTSKKATMGEKTFIMDDSKTTCSYGGTLTITDHAQRPSAGGSNSLMASSMPGMMATENLPTLNKIEIINQWVKQQNKTKAIIHLR